MVVGAQWSGVAVTTELDTGGGAGRSGVAEGASGGSAYRARARRGHGVGRACFAEDEGADAAVVAPVDESEGRLAQVARRVVAVEGPPFLAQAQHGRHRAGSAAPMARAAPRGSTGGRWDALFSAHAYHIAHTQVLGRNRSPLGAVLGTALLAFASSSNLNRFGPDFGRFCAHASASAPKQHTFKVGAACRLKRRCERSFQ